MSEHGHVASRLYAISAGMQLAVSWWSYDLGRPIFAGVFFAIGGCILWWGVIEPALLLRSDKGDKT